MSYTIRKVEPNELALLLPLMKDCFGMEVDVSYFQWKFLDNPAGSFVGFAAFHEESGDCAGYYGVIPEQYVVDGKPSIIFQSGDTMTHSKHRRQGLFFKLATACYQYLEAQSNLFVIGFGGGQSTPGLEKLGWRHLFPIRYFGIPRLVCTAYKGLDKITGKKYQFQQKNTHNLATELAAN
ncbi:MAG: GNAT family N-acetyltransferase, partial [Chitinophagaceae bacterium]